MKYLPLIALVFVSPIVSAELVTYQFEGHVTNIDNFTDSEQEAIEINDLLSGSFTLDTGLDPIFNNGSSVGWINPAVAVDITIGDYAISFDTTPNQFHTAQLVLAGTQSQSGFGTAIPTVSNIIGGWQISRLVTTVVDTDNIAFDSPTMPLSFEGADIFTGGLILSSVLGVDGIIDVQFAITSLEATPVPVPPALWLFVSALVSLKLSAKRRNLSPSSAN